MKKSLAKKVYKKAEELRTVLMAEYWKLDNIQPKNKAQKEMYKEISKMLEEVKKIEEPVQYSVLPKGAMSWSKFDMIMQEHNDAGNHIDGIIVYKASNFEKKYQDILERSYVVNSNNKIWKSGAGGYSLFGTNLTGKDECIRLEHIGWTIEYCYLMDEKTEQLFKKLNK